MERGIKEAGWKGELRRQGGKMREKRGGVDR